MDSQAAETAKREQEWNDRIESQRREQEAQAAEYARREREWNERLESQQRELELQATEAAKREQEWSELLEAQWRKQEEEVKLRAQLEHNMQEAAAAAEKNVVELSMESSRLVMEREETERILQQISKEQEILLDQHNKLKIEYSKLQTEFNEWIELIEQS